MIIDILTTSEAAVWTQERIIFKGFGGSEFAAGHSVKVWTDLEGSTSNPIATYTCAADNSVYIDMTDYIRTYPQVDDIFFDGQGFESPIDIEMHVMGLINPATALIPKHDVADAAYIVPPTKIISANGFYHALQFELRPITPYLSWTTKEWDESGTLVHQGITPGGAVVLDDTIVSKIELSDSGKVITRVFRSMLCDKEYALVKWISFTGIERRHVWEVVKHTISQADVTSLVTMDDNYHEIKGRVDGLTIMLDGLNAYDFWYYSDVVTSGNVQISLDGGVTYERVQVTSKSATIPDGDGANGKLEITINWRHYDAVDM